jgi:hypothetical protein
MQFEKRCQHQLRFFRKQASLKKGHAHFCAMSQNRENLFSENKHRSKRDMHTFAPSPKIGKPFFPKTSIAQKGTCALLRHVPKTGKPFFRKQASLKKGHAHFCAKSQKRETFFSENKHRSKRDIRQNDPRQMHS